MQPNDGHVTHVIRRVRRRQQRRRCLTSRSQPDLPTNCRPTVPKGLARGAEVCNRYKRELTVYERIVNSLQ